MYSKTICWCLVFLTAILGGCTGLGTEADFSEAKQNRMTYYSGGEEGDFCHLRKADCDAMFKDDLYKACLDAFRPESDGVMSEIIANKKGARSRPIADMLYYEALIFDRAEFDKLRAEGVCE